MKIKNPVTHLKQNERILENIHDLFKSFVQILQIQ